MMLSSLAKIRQPSVYIAMMQSWREYKKGSILDWWKPLARIPWFRCWNQLRTACLQPYTLHYNCI